MLLTDNQFQFFMHNGLRRVLHLQTGGAEYCWEADHKAWRASGAPSAQYCSICLPVTLAQAALEHPLAVLKLPQPQYQNVTRKI